MPEINDCLNIPEDSLKKRYFYKLFSNLINFLFNLGSQAIIPRALGPAGYGDFNFLTNFFSQLTGFLDMGTSTCFYTKLSQRSKEQGLISFYFVFTGIVFVLMVFFTGVLIATGAHSAVWPNQQIPYIYLALGLGFMIWLSQVINSIPDAYGLTVPAEKLKIYQKFMAIFILLILFVTRQLNLKNYFLFNYAIWLIFISFLIALISKSGYLIKEKIIISSRMLKGYTSEFWKYSHPLFTYSLVVLIAGIFDRWILQIFGGSVQQGFYSLSYQIGAICLVLTGAMTPLFMRELSIAHSNNDPDKMKHMFRRYVPLMYAITAYFSCFIAIEAERVVYIFGGNSFKGAVIAVAIMAFYPMHQTYGQLSSSVFYATGQTKLYRNIGIIFILIGLPVTYFLIAPSNKMGINAGAVGLAIKMVAFNIIGVNAQLYFNAKHLRFNYWRYLGHQIVIVGIFIVFAMLANFIAASLLNLRGQISVFLGSGVLYSALVIISVYFSPMILGLRRNDINTFIYKCGIK